jgi:RNA polymerase sigma factor (sigma-70 family)
MLNRQQEVVLPHLCRLIGPQVGGQLCDRQLLERFLGQGDPAAFAALVRRHGPTVLGVCRRVLRHAHDAEDAFQATFLVLVRRGRSIARREALGSWLYGVAYRVSLKARAEAVRRRDRESQAACRADEPSPDVGGRDDLRRVIDEEVNRLPDKYRRPVVLCYFEGKTYQETARLLGWPAGIASTRLARARDLLRARLARRGLALSGVALAAWLAEGTASTAEACLLAEATSGVAVRFAADPADAGVATRVIALTEGVVKAMFVQKLKALAGVVLAVGVVCGGAGAVWRLALTAPAAAADRARETPAGEAGAPADETPAAAGRRLRTAAAAVSPPFLAAEPPGQAPEAPAGPPPQALAPPVYGATRPPQTRIGLINLTRVLKGSKKLQAAQADLLGRMDKVNEKVDALKAEVQKYQADCDDPATPAARRDESARQVARLRKQIEDDTQRARTMMAKVSGDTLSATYREVEDMARRFANAQGLELVLFYTDALTEADFYKPEALQRKLAQPGALMPMVVAPGMDITDSVIEALNRTHPAPDHPQR